VLESMVKFLSLKEGENVWADRVLEMTNVPRSCVASGNAAVNSSGFSIENSASSLLAIYTTHISSTNVSG